MGIDDFRFNFFATFWSGLGLQFTVLIRVSQFHWDCWWRMFKSVVPKEFHEFRGGISTLYL